jgi:protein TonB
LPFSSVALVLSLFASPALSQDKPQQDTPPPPAEKKITRVKIGGIETAKMLKYRVQPVYPHEARAQGLEGTVKMRVLIAKNGSVAKVELISASYPLLAGSAIQAVRQWKYRPTLLNGEPVEVDTTVDVIFALNR